MEEKTPQISVIVPVYNVEKYLHKCVDSILAQTLSDIELILVDDGSPDGSGAICDEYAQKDSRVKVIHKPNGGVSSARNAGIDVASGEWICFVDSDDIIEPTYLDDFELLTTKADLYLQGYKKIINGEVKEIHSFSGFQGNRYIEILAFTEDERIINSPCFKLYNRDIVHKKKIRFDINTSYGEDHIFSLEYAICVTSAHYSNASGYCYMVNGVESLSHRIIPLKDIVYYSKKSRKIQMLLLSKYRNKSYLASINKRQEATITKIIRELFAIASEYKNYQFVYNECVPLIRNNGLYGLKIKRKIFMIIFGYMPPKLTYETLNFIL